MADTHPAQAVHQHPDQAVRFSSATQEISPDEQGNSIHLVNTLAEKERDESLTEEQKKELRDLSVSLVQSRMQSARMHQFVFDPVSLPPSRVRLIFFSPIPTPCLTKTNIKNLIKGSIRRVIHSCPIPQFSNVQTYLPESTNTSRFG